MKSKANCIALVVMCLISLSAMLNVAGANESGGIEIQYLLETTGDSDCTFVRNGKAHSAAEAESHLRMKYQNGKSWVNNAEQFIDRIASKSTWTGKLYYIDCPDLDRLPAGDWLHEQLDSYRSQLVAY